MFKLHANLTDLVGAPDNTGMIECVDSWCIIDGDEQNVRFGPIDGAHTIAVLRGVGAVTGKGKIDDDGGDQFNLIARDAMDESTHLGSDLVTLPIPLYLSQMENPKLLLDMKDPLTHFAGGTSGPTTGAFTLKVNRKRGYSEEAIGVSRVYEKATRQHGFTVPNGMVATAAVLCAGSSYSDDWERTSYQAGDVNGQILDDDFLLQIERFETRSVEVIGATARLISGLYLPAGSKLFQELETADEMWCYFIGTTEVAERASDKPKDAAQGKASSVPISGEKVAMQLDNPVVSTTAKTDSKAKVQIDQNVLELLNRRKLGGISSIFGGS